MTEHDHQGTSGHGHGHGGGGGVVDWDEHYSAEKRVWSGNPNHALVTEMGGMTPGRALDVGCGEGADAIWLAQQGWRVTALDVSSVALERGRAAAAEAGVEVTWVHAGLTEAALPEGGFDLVSAFYPAIPDSVGEPLATLLRLVAPGGTLLFVHHADVDWTEARERGFDPDAYLQVEEVAAGVPADWTVVVDGKRDREISGGGGAQHHVDHVVRAVRPASP
ncbi:MAG: methyltransferase domain-containing protein [Nocardioidaceae bacterium]|nr:methyltransferase domain-containing protein [Nocardioidaceae bacterium]